MSTRLIDIASRNAQALGETYARCLTLLEPYWSGAPHTPRHVLKRVAVRILEAAGNDADVLIGLTLMRRREASVVEHSLKTGIYLAAMTGYLSLPRRVQYDATLAGLCHHLGQDTHGPYANNRSALAQRSLLNILLYPIPDASHYRQLLAAFEHDLGFDGTGEPRVDLALRHHPLASFLTVASDFAGAIAGVSPEGKRSEPVLASAALSLMEKRSGSRYHPGLFALLARVVGPFPVGSILRLRSGKLALVTRYRPADKGWAADALELGSTATALRLNSEQPDEVVGVLGTLNDFPN